MVSGQQLVKLNECVQDSLRVESCCFPYPRVRCYPKRTCHAQRLERV